MNTEIWRKSKNKVIFRMGAYHYVQYLQRILSICVKTDREKEKEKDK